MHFNLKRAIGVTAIPLLGSALVVAAVAHPANATTYTDTGLANGTVTATAFAGGNLSAADSGASDIQLSSTGTTVAWVLHGTTPTAGGVVVSPAGLVTYTGAASAVTSIVVDVTDANGNVSALSIPVVTGTNTIQTTIVGATQDTVSALSGTTTGGVITFTAANGGPTITFAEPNLPTGLTSANPLTYVSGTAAPGSYPLTHVTATDTMGALQKGTFTLSVSATSTGTGSSASGYGDEVNNYGNGFDVYQQHQWAGALIAGWTATQADPATHFLALSGTHSGSVKFEYAPKGWGTGLCVADPAGGSSSDPLRDGLVLAVCNNGAWQQFVSQSNGTLKNVATGLTVNPAGTGGQLRGGTTATTWGGSTYTWTDYTNLPA
jgi:hypothetical protein